MPEHYYEEPDATRVSQARLEDLAVLASIAQMQRNIEEYGSIGSQRGVRGGMDPLIEMVGMTPISKFRALKAGAPKDFWKALRFLKKAPQTKDMYKNIRDLKFYEKAEPGRHEWAVGLFSPKENVVKVFKENIRGQGILDLEDYVRVISEELKHSKDLGRVVELLEKNRRLGNWRQGIGSEGPLLVGDEAKEANEIYKRLFSGDYLKQPGEIVAKDFAKKMKEYYRYKKGLPPVD